MPKSSAGSTGFSRQDLWITTVSIFELRYGIELHAKGRRRNQLEDSLARVLDAGFKGRVLNFDQEAANAAAFISAKRRASGQPNEIRDVLIAGIVISQRADLATRNVRHFHNLEILRSSIDGRISACDRPVNRSTKSRSSKSDKSDFPSACRRTRRNGRRRPACGGA